MAKANGYFYYEVSAKNFLDTQSLFEKIIDDFRE